MPAYNFKQQFAEAVESGKKRQTIRPKRKRPTKPGDILYLNTGMRTKSYRRLREAKCLSVASIHIDQLYISVDGQILSMAEKHELAQADGFTTLQYFREFFRDHYGLPCDLELIKW